LCQNSFNLLSRLLRGSGQPWPVRRIAAIAEPSLQQSSRRNALAALSYRIMIHRKLYPLLLVALCSCPPPPPETTPKPQGPTPEQLALCLGVDWTRPRSIEPILKARCNDPVDSFEQKIQGCFSYDWANGAIPQKERELCEQVGFQERVIDCKSKNWSEPDLIDPDERRFCHSIGFSDVVDLQICAAQDWSALERSRPILREQCELLTQKTECEKHPERCDQRADEKSFHHAAHGIDLPYEKATPADKEKIRNRANLVGKIKGRDITCADCHNGECSPKQSSQTYCTPNRTDISRPYHFTCAGTGGAGCHAFITVKKGDSLTCDACHLGAKVVDTDPKLKAYGATKPGLLFGFDFAHSSHLSTEVMQKNGGKALATCESCHSKTKDGELTQATHESCNKCHSNKSNKVQMTDCLQCHLKDTHVDVKSDYQYLRNQLATKTFKHSMHQTGPDGAAVSCETCHGTLAESSSLVSIKAPTMLGCLQSCHDGSHVNDKKFTFDGWIECTRCHQ
jgi:hypothetical protein